MGEIPAGLNEDRTVHMHIYDYVLLILEITAITHHPPQDPYFVTANLQ